MHLVLEIKIPIFCKKEHYDTHSPYYNDGEELYKFYLSENQSKQILKEIQQNKYWKNLPMDEKLKEKINEHSTEIYSKIPEIKNGYWFFKNRCNGAKDVYSEEEMLKEGICAFSIGIFDLDNYILYYYALDN